RRGAACPGQPRGRVRDGHRGPRRERRPGGRLMFSLRRAAAVAGKEFRHLRRDRLSGGMIIGIPVVMTLLFGYAINTDVRHLPAAVADQAGTSASRAVVSAVQASGVVDIVAR